MKIFIYCQHVLGIGHYFRTLEICRSLSADEITLVTGGPPVETVLPEHVREIRLPPLKMDPNFSRLYALQKECSVKQIKKTRRQMLFSLYKKELPDVLILELYPFGRKAFSFEIHPLLQGIRLGILQPATVICSLRDILVEKKKSQQAYESRVVDTLNHYFDALLIHADPVLLKLDNTFSRVKHIHIPVVYTGFITAKPPADARDTMRNNLGISENEFLVVASLGGGSVGDPLLKATIKAFQQLTHSNHGYLIVFTGPFMDQKVFDDLKQFSNNRIQVNRFTSEFLSYLAAADLSVSMAGYNTCMNILSARVPALVWPFSQNREQGLRAKCLADIGAVKVLTDSDLEPARLATIMEKTLTEPKPLKTTIDLDGAAHTAKWITNWVPVQRGQGSGVGDQGIEISNIEQGTAE